MPLPLIQALSAMTAAIIVAPIAKRVARARKHHQSRFGGLSALVEETLLPAFSRSTDLKRIIYFATEYAAWPRSGFIRPGEATACVAIYRAYSAICDPRLRARVRASAATPMFCASRRSGRWIKDRLGHARAQQPQSYRRAYSRRASAA